MKNQDWLEHQVSFQKKSHHCNALNYSGIADLSESPDYWWNSLLESLAIQ